MQGKIGNGFVDDGHMRMIVLQEYGDGFPHQSSVSEYEHLFPLDTHLMSFKDLLDSARDGRKYFCLTARKGDHCGMRKHIDIFCDRYRIEYRLRIDRDGERELDDDAVDIIAERKHRYFIFEHLP